MLEKEFRSQHATGEIAENILNGFHSEERRTFKRQREYVVAFGCLENLNIY